MGLQMVKADKLLANGFLPKELPPCFQSRSLGELYLRDPIKMIQLATQSLNNKTWTAPSHFNLIRHVSEYRRLLSIPNPAWQIQICHYVENNWDTIENLFSSFSCSKPANSLVGSRTLTFSKTRQRDFYKKCPGAKVLLNVDISTFYDSIYTHSIPWAMMGKKAAKIAFRKDRTSLLGDDLDKFLQSSNEGHTKGIPTGPDTSLIIAEIILGRVDAEIQEKHPDLEFTRMIDDYWFYCRSADHAKEILVDIQNILFEYELRANEKKIALISLPHTPEPSWTNAIRRLETNGPKSRIGFFTTLAEIQRSHSDSDVMKFGFKIAIRRIKNQKWHLDTDLIGCLCDQVFHFPQVIPLLTQSPRTIDAMAKHRSFSKVLNAIIQNHAKKKNSYEVAWALWLACLTSTRLTHESSLSLNHLSDCVSLLMAEHAMIWDLVPKGSLPSTSSKAEASGYFGKNWLLYYEGLKNSHFSDLNASLVHKANANSLFDYLFQNNAFFFDFDEAWNEYLEDSKVELRNLDQAQTHWKQNESDEEDEKEDYDEAKIKGTADLVDIDDAI